MQTVMHVWPSRKQKTSLRETVIKDLKKFDLGLEVQYEMRPGRKNGWAKIVSNDVVGVINLEWDADSRTLVCRAISKSGNTTDEIVGRFVTYLLNKRGNSISGISIRPM